MRPRPCRGQLGGSVTRRHRVAPTEKENNVTSFLDRPIAFFVYLKSEWSLELVVLEQGWTTHQGII